MKARRTAMPQARRLALAAILSVVASIVAPSTVSADVGGAGDPSSVAAPPATAAGNTPFDRQGMWVWYVSRSEGGSAARIIARAKRAGIGTVYIKEGDGSDVWSQFNRPLVQALHQGGLDVCAWQFVYGDHPLAEAKVGGAAIGKGADCLVIDAESDYEGKYAAADSYVQALRARIGAAFPVSLAGFPYVDYHPSFPYSVFFGPGGAQYNQPQMYWKAIGTSVRAVFEHTYLFNRLWGKPIYPIGQTYDNPGSGPVKLFRRFAASYGGAPSWWDWQETSTPTWGALGSIIKPVPGYRPIVTQPLLKHGSSGDLVVWAQEHLIAAGQRRVQVTGIYGKQTYAAVRSFQSAHGLPADGVIATPTWRALLEFAPAAVHWAGGIGVTASSSSARARPRQPSRPLSASLPAKAYEIGRGPTP